MVMLNWRFTPRLPTNSNQKLDHVYQHAIVNSQGMTWSLLLVCSVQAICASISCVAYKVLHLL